MLPSCDSAETLESGQELHEVVAGVLVVLPEHVILVTGPEDGLLLAVAVEELEEVVLVLGDLVEECHDLVPGNIELPRESSHPVIACLPSGFLLWPPHSRLRSALIPVIPSASLWLILHALLESPTGGAAILAIFALAITLILILPVSVVLLPLIAIGTWASLPAHSPVGVHPC